MLFRESTEYNSSDTSYVIGINSCHTIKHGVEERCRRSLLILARNIAGLILDEIVSAMRRYGSGRSYKRSAVKYALRRLIEEGLVFYNSRTRRYRAGANVLRTWQVLEKYYA